MKKKPARVLVEMAFIIFLFYSNLLMGEFERSGMGNKRGFVWALGDILSFRNFLIAVISAFIGHMVFDFFRRKY
ncbi:MAG TPA: hypothetical protein VMV20_07850 [Chitinophagaceae bacterium]|nr:hypothetical protein [Chitinophagaceae bacterium]